MPSLSWSALLLIALLACVASAPVDAQRKRPGKRGEVNTPPARGERHRTQLKQGDVAPDFTLTDLAGKKKVMLSSFQGKQPVVLIFGSYT